MLSIVSVNDCVSFCDVCLCFDCYSIDSSFSNNRCRRYLLLLVIQPWEYLIKLSDWLIVVYVCMVLLLAFMNDCVAFCDISGCDFIDISFLPCCRSTSFYFISINYYSLLLFICTTMELLHPVWIPMRRFMGMASPDAVLIPMRLFVVCHPYILLFY